MWKVYFESKTGGAKVVAIFKEESTYIACLAALEERCKREGYDFVTEHLIEEEEGYISIDTHLY